MLGRDLLALFGASLARSAHVHALAVLRELAAFLLQAWHASITTLAKASV